jgi:tRNA 2-thiouridine synthesizing protein A
MDHKIVDFTPDALYLDPMIHDLDARGLLCPLPVLKARKRLKDLAQGDVLRMHADDPAARIDVPHFCNESGNILRDAADQGDGSFIYDIEKA